MAGKVHAILDSAEADIESTKWRWPSLAAGSLADVRAARAEVAVQQVLEQALEEAQAELDDLRDRVKGFIRGLDSGTTRFMNDMTTDQSNVRGISGESAALIVQERAVITENLKGLVK